MAAGAGKGAFRAARQWLNCDWIASRYTTPSAVAKQSATLLCDGLADHACASRKVHRLGPASFNRRPAGLPESPRADAALDGFLGGSGDRNRRRRRQARRRGGRPPVAPLHHEASRSHHNDQKDDANDFHSRSAYAGCDRQDSRPKYSLAGKKQMYSCPITDGRPLRLNPPSSQAGAAPQPLRLCDFLPLALPARGATANAAALRPPRPCPLMM